MIKNLIIERSNIPPQMLEWLESDEKRMGILLYHEENNQVVLERLENIDPTMLSRVRANMERYHSALEKLSDG